MTHSIRMIVAAVFGATVIVAGGAAAQGSKPMKEEKPGLLAQAKISADAARTTALARIKSGTIKEEEIEMEGGKLVFAFDIKVARKSGVEEVLVDALTGEIVSVAHESSASESAEAAKELKEKKSPKKP